MGGNCRADSDLDVQYLAAAVNAGLWVDAVRAEGTTVGVLGEPECMDRTRRDNDDAGPGQRFPAAIELYLDGSAPHDQYLVEVQSLSKVQGKPFKVSEIYDRILELSKGEATCLMKTA